jgi:hypothetical protein
MGKILRGPDGLPLTLDALPPPGARGLRWTMFHKARLMLAIEGGLLTVDEARALSVDG